MQIGIYTLTHRIGAGAMGVVFRALDPAGKPVALKMIGPQARINATIFARPGANKLPALDLKRRMALVREAGLAKGLNHPNIVKVFDYGTHEGMLYIAMEFLDGRPLDKVVPLRAAIPFATRIGLIRQLCDALEYAHGQGVIHRDVKPANCHVLTDGTLKVLDFGIAARAMRIDGGEGRVAGTWYYMAPELFAKAGDIDRRIDIWAAGITLYQLLTGRVPFFAPSVPELVRRIVNAPLPPLDESLPQAQELNRILNRALAKAPHERYASAAELARDLAQLDGQVEEKAPSAAVAEPDGRGKDPWWATTVAMPAEVTSASPALQGMTIEAVSGGTPWRHGGNLLRFAEYNKKILPLPAIALVVACIFTGFRFLAGSNIDSRDIFSFGAPVLLYFFLAQAGAYLTPIVVAVALVLGALALWERSSWLHRCRTCKTWMEHRSRFTAFAYSKASWRHATSDCQAALDENLWEDAARLLTMHGELYPPDPEERTTYPLVRHHLDMFRCASCGDELALLTTDFAVTTGEKQSKSWSTDELYQGAYRKRGGADAKASSRDSRSAALKSIRRGLQEVREQISPATAAFLIAASALMVALYYPQILIVTGAPGYRASITIEPDATGHPVEVDGTTISAPRTFSWAYYSTHRIVAERRFYLKDDLYAFKGLTPASMGPDSSSISADGSYIITNLRIYPVDDRWHRPTAHPVASRFTVEYARNAPSLSANGPANLRDMLDTAHDVMRSVEKAREEKAASVGIRAGASRGSVPQTIVVATEPPGLAVVVDGVRITTPKAFHWPLGSGHVLIAPVGSQVLTQGESGATATYTDGCWKSAPRLNQIAVGVDGGMAPGTITYTAKFRRVTPAGSPGPVTARSADEK